MRNVELCHASFILKMRIFDLNSALHQAKYIMKIADAQRKRGNQKERPKINLIKRKR